MSRGPSRRGVAPTWMADTRRALMAARTVPSSGSRAGDASGGEALSAAQTSEASSTRRKSRASRQGTRAWSPRRIPGAASQRPSPLVRGAALPREQDSARRALLSAMDASAQSIPSASTSSVENPSGGWARPRAQPRRTSTTPMTRPAVSRRGAAMRLRVLRPRLPAAASSAAESKRSSAAASGTTTLRPSTATSSSSSSEAPPSSAAAEASKPGRMAGGVLQLSDVYTAADVAWKRPQAAR
mmetsp:Transcript_20968/g.50046  ORF Transcript_20968/g.50046 Transcript_20968/m.50046 type:complete len:242 (+) Transcript_20968:2107-2832(+)